ncbi:Abhydrolase_6 domain-containing protein, partial [Cephalotus follicularis]
MVNIISLYTPFLQWLMEIVGFKPQRVEIEPGTILNFWVPIETTKKETQNHNKKPVVVLLHGFAANGILTWQFQVLALRKTYRVYVPDFLFYGDSITDKSDRTVDFQAECMAKGLGKLGVERCTLVGFSYGGIVGFKMAEKYPHLVESLVVTGSVIALTQSISNAALERIGFKCWADYLLPSSGNDVKLLLDIASYKFPWLPKFVYEDFLETMFNYRKEKIELLEASVISDVAFNIPRYTQKISLLWGENDRIFDMETAQNLKCQVAEKATMQSIGKAGHLVHLEKPFIYNRQLKEILASLTEEKGYQK